MQQSNLDATRARIVRKGVKVRGLDGRTGRVTKTSRGACLVLWEGQRYCNSEYCREVTVMPEPRPRLGPPPTPEQTAKKRELRAKARLMRTHGLHASADALQSQLRALYSEGS